MRTPALSRLPLSRLPLSRLPLSRLPLSRLLVGIALCLSVTTGCSPSSDDGAGTPSSSPSSSASSSAPGSPTAPAPPSSTSPSASSSASPASDPTSDPTSPGPLLSADELPGLDDAFRWRQGRTTVGEPARSFATCQRFGILSIGAERVVVRRFLPRAGASRASAGELLATFPDEITARRAFSVLTAWRSRCADRLSDYARRDVGPLQDVAVPQGRAAWYLLTYGPVSGSRDPRYLDAQGMVMVGSRIALLTMRRADGDDDTSTPRVPTVPAVPMVATLRQAARKLT